MTDEGKSDTEKWIEKKGVKYAYAYDKGGALQRFFGVQGIPHAILVDPQGKIVWRGHPAGLEEDVISKAVKGALPKPMWDWPASAKGVKTAFAKQQYGTALGEAQKLSESDGGPTIVAALKSIIDARVKTMKSAFAAGDFLQASDLATALAKGLDDLPEQADAEKVLADLKGNKDAERVIKAQKQIRDIRGSKLERPKEIDKAIGELKKIAKDNGGTFAATEATALIEELETRKRSAR